jgi:dienelactone hydrolase
MIGASRGPRARYRAGKAYFGSQAVSACGALVSAAAIGAAALVVPMVSVSPATAAPLERKVMYGAFGPEGPRLREQFWLLPSGDPKSPLRATVFRPEDEGSSSGEVTRRPLVVINHGTSDATRLAVAMPVYYWLSRWFVERGYVVLLPQRRGHGATGGPLAESIGSCADPDHFQSGLAAAADIEAATDYLSGEPFVAPREAIVVGISSGGWAALALASRNPANVRAVVNIAGGRGGRPSPANPDRAVCGEPRLIEAAHAYGATSQIPTLWLYASNDSYFRPELAQRLAGAWQGGGGKAELHIFPPYGPDGHNLADDRAGWDVWGDALGRFIEAIGEQPVAVSAPLSVPPALIEPPQANSVAAASVDVPPEP